MYRRAAYRSIKEGVLNVSSPIYAAAKRELTGAEFERAQRLAIEAPAPNPDRDVKNPEDWNVIRLVCYRYNK